MCGGASATSSRSSALRHQFADRLECWLTIVESLPFEAGSICVSEVAGRSLLILGECALRFDRVVVSRPAMAREGAERH